jgi:hypothetical protein
MMDALHRILSGSPDNRKQLAFAGVFIMFWFTIDFVEWVDWLMLKINPPFTTMCVPLEMMPSAKMLAMPPIPDHPYIDNIPFRIDRDR